MMKRLRSGVLLIPALMVAQVSFAADGTNHVAESHTEKQVRKELVMLPFYNLFDSLSFTVSDDSVTLMGKVTRPTLKSEAENVVKKIEGVNTVNNRIEVLPLSPNDDRLRASLYQAIYGHTTLQTLAMRAVPPIHILVEDGHVTLEGAVGNGMQKSVAGIQANTVPGVFSVTNNLLVDSVS